METRLTKKLRYIKPFNQIADQFQSWPMISVWSSGVYIDSFIGMNSCVNLKSESMTAMAQTATDGLNDCING